MRTAHFYDKATGLFTGRLISSSVHEGFAELAALNCPQGHAHVEGVKDHRLQKVNLFTGELEDHRPERPSRDHEWSHERKRWQLSAGRQAAEAQRALRDQEIERLQEESRELVRKAVLGDAQAHAHLAILDQRISALRAGK